MNFQPTTWSRANFQFLTCCTDFLINWERLQFETWGQKDEDRHEKLWCVYLLFQFSLSSLLEVSRAQVLFYSSVSSWQFQNINWRACLVSFCNRFITMSRRLITPDSNINIRIKLNNKQRSILCTGINPSFKNDPVYLRPIINCYIVKWHHQKFSRTGRGVKLD